MSDATGVAEALLGLPGFRVLDVHESAAELVIEIETTAELVGCPGCGVVARAHERMAVEYRDLAAFGRPARLRWAKRRWRCEEPACALRSWTESSPSFSARCLLTDRAGRECCLQGAAVDRMLLGIRAGDPDDEVLGAWLAKESVRDVYLSEDAEAAALLLDKAIVGCVADPVPEVGGLGRTLGRWRTEILNHHATGASNGPTEGLNLLIKKVKRAGHGFRSFANYRLRILLHAGGVDWP